MYLLTVRLQYPSVAEELDRQICFKVNMISLPETTCSLFIRGAAR